VLGHAFGEIERRWPADEMLHQAVEFAPEAFVVLGVLPGLRQFQNQRHQGFGDVKSAELAKPALGVRLAVAVSEKGIAHRGVPLAINVSKRLCVWQAQGAPEPLRGEPRGA